MPKQFEWKEEYSVGVKEIDYQHKQLVITIEKLSQAISEGHAKEVLHEILDTLAKYAVDHFQTEEKYFDQFNYEFSKEHKELHADFKAKVVEFIEKAKSNQIKVSFELIDFLEDWLLDHLVTADQKYVKCFKENGLS
jgi:hemerythrin-like metal-binding protein